MRPFSSAEDKFFFGRESVTAEVLELLQANKFVALAGPSASGKTSLIQSGVVPTLLTDEKQEWIPISIRPGQKPLENLIRGFQQVFPKKLREADVQHFLGSSQQLGDLIVEKGLGSHNYLLVVDQFEDLFRSGPDRISRGKDQHIRRFIDLLVKMARSERPGIYVLLSIRSDFLEESSFHRSLTELMNRSKYLLPQMSREALISSITGPVQIAGARYEEGFVEYLLEDLEDLDNPLPQLQHALMRTWDYWSGQEKRDQAITIGDYQAIGTVRSALQDHLEEIYAELDEKQQGICERLFKSITAKSEQHNGYLRQASMGNIARIAHCSLEDLAEVVEKFRKPNRAFILPLSASALASDALIELSHESLIRNWTRLHDWVEEENESIRMYLKLSEASSMYQQGRTELWRHPELQEAINWRESQNPTPAWGVQFHPAFERAMVFLKTSEEERLWEEERKISSQRKRMILNRAIAVFMALVVVVLAGVFYLSRTRPAPAQDTAQADTQEYVDVHATQPEFTQGNSDPGTEAGTADGGADALEVEDGSPGSSINLDEVMGSQGQVDDAGTSEPVREQPPRNTPVRTGSQTSTQQSSSSSSSSRPAPARTSPSSSARNLDVARRVARHSLTLSGDPELQGLLAYQAYRVNEKNKGKYYDGDIYDGLYAAMKKLISPAYNIYPNLRNSVKDIKWLYRTGSMITASSDGSLKILSGSFANKATQISLKNTGQNNECIIVRSDEKLAAVGTNGGGLLFLEMENQGTVVRQSMDGGKIILFLANLGKSGDFLAAGTENRILKWNYDSRESAEYINTEARPSALAASSNGQKVAYATRDGKLFELDASDPASAKVIGDYGRTHVRAIAYNPGGQIMVIGQLDGNLQVLSGSSRRQIASLKGPEASITDLAYSPDGRFLAAASNDGKVYLWNSDDWSNPPRIFDENNGFVLSVCFNGNSGYFYSGSVDYPRMIGRPSESARMVQDFCSLVGRNLSRAEWEQYFGTSIPYERSCPDLNE